MVRGSPSCGNMQRQWPDVEGLPIVGVNVESRDRDVSGVVGRDEKVISGRIRIGIVPRAVDRQPADMGQVELARFSHRSAERNRDSSPDRRATHDHGVNFDRRCGIGASREHKDGQPWQQPAPKGSFD